MFYIVGIIIIIIVYLSIEYINIVYNLDQQYKACSIVEILLSLLLLNF